MLWGWGDTFGLSTPTRPVYFIIYLHQRLNCPIREASDDELDWKKEGRWKTEERVRDQRRGKQMRKGQRHERKRKRETETRG